jgi:hypothetical protein
VVTLESAHRAEPGFESAVLGFDPVIRYWAVLWNAAGMGSSITARSAGARSVTTSAGSPWSPSAIVKNRQAACVSRRAET